MTEIKAAAPKIEQRRCGERRRLCNPRPNPVLRRLPPRTGALRIESQIKLRARQRPHGNISEQPFCNGKCGFDLVDEGEKSAVIVNHETIAGATSRDGRSRSSILRFRRFKRLEPSAPRILDILPDVIPKAVRLPRRFRPRPLEAVRFIEAVNFPRGLEVLQHSA